VSAKSDLIYQEGPDKVTHEFVHARFLELLQRDQDTGLSEPWKKALLELPNPMESKKRPPLKRPVFLALCLAVMGITVFVWFSFLY
jgi:hypothetical protein